jgi:hypothetical protein
VIVDSGDGLLSVLDDFSSYQWYVDGVAIIGATGPTYQAEQAGNYEVYAFAEQGCYSLSDIFDYTPVAVSLAEMDELSTMVVYPNPAQDHIMIKGLGNAPFSYTIRTIEGRILDTGWVSSARVDVSGLASGVYILEVYENVVLFREQLLIE